MPPRHPAAIALLLACASARPTIAPPVGGRATEPPPIHAAELQPLVPADLRVMHEDRLEGTLASDGSIALDGAPFARMEGLRVVSAEGRELAVLGADGSLRFEGAARPGRLLPEGVVEGPDGQRMALRDDGHVVFTDPAHPNDHVALVLRVEGVTERSRRAAVVLVGVLMFRARAQAAGR